MKKLFLVVLALLLAGCAKHVPAGEGAGASADPSAGPQAATPTASPTPDPKIILAPNVSSGATDVPVDTMLKVDVQKGKLTKVEVTGTGKDAKGKDATSTINGDLTEGSWQATSRLAPGMTYTLTSTGTGDDGLTKTSSITFSTVNLSLKQQIFPSVSPQGGTFGVAMPVIVKFDIPVQDHKSFQDHMKVTTSPQQEGSWAWLSDTEAHWRPKEFWQAGTKVKVEADLAGVSAGGGKFGQTSKTTEFTIGKSQITEVDLEAKQLVQKSGGQVVRRAPISAGKPGFITRSGTKVITEKLSQTRMASETIGINNNDPNNGYDLQVKWAMRITDSGEFIHAAPWNTGNLGKVNSSHGCVGMSESDAQALFSSVQVGDPVVVKGSNRGLEPGNGITDWNVGWDRWKSWSA